MNHGARPVSERQRARLAALGLARAQLASSRQRFRGSADHRAVHSATLKVGRVVQSLLMVALLTGVLIGAQAPIMHAWSSVILYWSELLDIPLSAGDAATGLLVWTSRDGNWLMPTPLISTATALGVVVLYTSTYWMSDAFTPLKYLVRTLCVVQGSAVAFFMLFPSQFAYTVPGHLQAMLSAGYALMLAVPALLGLGYAILKLPVLDRLLHPALVLAYLGLMLPHKAVLHVLVLQHLSVLYMPLLYLCFGVVFDVMIFVALYSWLASRVPADAMG
jgi:hypothetical protein